MGSITNSLQDTPKPVQGKQPRTRIGLWRGITQLGFLALLNPYFFNAKTVCMPVLNCWACPAAAFACPVGAIGQFFAQGIFPLLVIGMILLGGAFIGRMFCGWVCPFGFIQDMLYKIRSKKFHIPQSLTYIKYFILLITVIAIPLFFGVDIIPGKIVPQDFFFCRLCPAASLEATIPLSFMPLPAAGTTTTPNELIPVYQITNPNPVIALLISPRVWALILLLVSFVFMSRFFCRVFCPQGAILALLNRLSIYKMSVNKDKCTKCKLCHKVCPTDQSIYITANTNDCIRCLECEKKCPAHAITS
jgi:polyferredoxin